MDTNQKQKLRPVRTGNQYGRLTVLSKADKLNGRTAWLCRCSCENERVILAQSLKAGLTQSCGCLFGEVWLKLKNGQQQRAKELIGKTFGKWTLVSLTPRRTRSGGLYFNCTCECGQVREVTSDSLTRGSSRSCGICGIRQKPFCGHGHDVARFGGRTPSGSCRACVFEKRLRRAYGIGLEDYETLWKAQDGKCAICGCDLGTLFGIGKQGFGRGSRAEVDHEHNKDLTARQSVRGLLCGGRWAGCNRKLGRLDKVDWLSSALAYIQSPPARLILNERG